MGGSLLAEGWQGVVGSMICLKAESTGVPDSLEGQIQVALRMTPNLNNWGNGDLTETCGLLHRFGKDDRLNKYMLGKGREEIKSWDV